MLKQFKRTISFNVEGDLYTPDAKPDDVIKNYNWSFDDNVDGNIQLFGYHDDKNGRITKMAPTGSYKKTEPLIL